MRKLSMAAGMLFLFALLFAAPSRADNVVDYTLTGDGIATTFSLPQTFTPSSIVSPIAYVNAVPGTLFGGPLVYGTIDLGLFGYLGVTDYWSFGSTGSPGHPAPEIGIYATGLFTFNPDGSVTLNGGTWALGDYHLFSGGTTRDSTLTATVVSTPEPATLSLLGLGGLVLAGIRRRKTV
jgi:hypothetical protein